MNDLKFMASDGNMYPAEWFGEWQAFDKHEPPVGLSLCHFPSILNPTHWRLNVNGRHPPKPKKIYDEYLDEDGDFELEYFRVNCLRADRVSEYPDEARALIAFIQDNLPKE